MQSPIKKAKNVAISGLALLSLSGLTGCAVEYYDDGHNHRYNT